MKKCGKLFFLCLFSCSTLFAQYQWVQGTDLDFSESNLYIEANGDTNSLLIHNYGPLTAGIPAQTLPLPKGQGRLSPYAGIFKINTGGNVITMDLLDTANSFNANSVKKHGNKIVISGANHLYNNNSAGTDTISRASIMVYKHEVGPLWKLDAYQDPGPFQNFSYFNAVSVDQNGNIYAVGMYTGNIRIGQQTLPLDEEKSYFICKLDSTGNCLWLKKYGRYMGYRPRQISNLRNLFLPLANDFNGDILTVLSYTQSGGPLTIGSQSFSNLPDGFYLVRIKPNGDVADIDFVSKTFQEIRSMAINKAGQIYITGSVIGDTIDGIPVTSRNLMIQKRRPDGSKDWERVFLHPDGTHVGNDICLDKNDYIYVAGQFRGRLNLGNQILNENSFFSPFVAAFDPAGNVMYGAGATKIPGKNGRSIFNEIVCGGDPTLVYAAGFLEPLSPDSIVTYSYPLFNQSAITFTAKRPGVKILAKLAFPGNRIEIDSILPTTICSGTKFKVRFTAFGNYEASNKFYLQVSDSSGSFFSVRQNIDSIVLSNAPLYNNIKPTYSLNFPALQLPAGRRHRVRVVASNLPTVGASSEIEFRILNAFAGPDQILCNVNQGLLKADSGFGQGLWTSNNPLVSFQNPNLENSLVSNLAPGNNYLVWKKTFGECQAIDSVNIRFATDTSGGITRKVIACKNDSAFIKLSPQQISSAFWSDGTTSFEKKIPVPSSIQVRLVLLSGCQINDTINAIADTSFFNSGSVKGPFAVCPNEENIKLIFQSSNISKVNWQLKNADFLYGQGSEEICITAGQIDSISILALPVSEFGCSGDTIKYSIPIKNQFALGAISGQDSICEGKSGTYFYKGKKGIGRQWFLNRSLLSTETSGDSALINFPNSGHVKVIQTINNNGALCIGKSDSLFVNLIKKPITRTTILSDSIFCGVGPFLIETTPKNDESYDWAVSEGLQVISQNGGNIQVQIVDTLAKNLNLKLFSQNSFGCRSKIDSGSLRYNPLPIPIFQPGNYWICPKETGSKSYSVLGKKGSSFSWKVEGANTSNTSDSKISVEWDLTANEFALEVIEIDSFGCKSPPIKKEILLDFQLNQNGSQCLRSNYPLIVPNLITPNNDNKNDYFNIANLEYYPETQISIINRWGKEIFKSDDYRQDFSFNAFDEGIYFYNLRTMQGQTINGYLQVIR